MDDYGISRVNADWIVSVWCICYGNKVLGKSCDISIQKQGEGPAIKDDRTSFAGKSYGDLFEYEKRSKGTGLAVTGFHGDKNQTIIFQNKSGNEPVVEIAGNSFRESSIEEAILTDGIKYIGLNAFSDCMKLHQVVLPISIEEIENSAFENCCSLKSVSLPMLLKTIGDAALKGTGLRTLDIPKSVFWIGNELLANCKSLEHIRIPENIGRIPDRMFRMAKKDRTGNRKTREQRKQFKVPELGYYLIVTDTEATERFFFTGLHKALPKDVRKKIVIKVVETKTRTMIDGQISRRRKPYLVCTENNRKWLEQNHT